MLAGKLFGIPIRGTHAHSFVTSFQPQKDTPLQVLIRNFKILFDFFFLIINQKLLKNLKTGELVDLNALSLKYLAELENMKFGFLESECNRCELAAFVGYSVAFPTEFLALVDTFNVLQ